MTPRHFRASGPGFLEARGNYNCRLNTGLDAVINQGRHSNGRGDNYREIDFFWNVGDAGISLDAQHATALVADRENGSAKGTADQAPEHRAANTSLTLRGPDDGNVVGRENGIQGLAFGPEHIVRFVLRGAGLNGLSCRFGSAHNLQSLRFW